MTATSKTIVGAPIESADMIAPWGLAYQQKGYLEPEQVAIAIPVNYDGAVRVKRSELTLESFYELREAVNALYDHIRQETPTD